jgi:hypothetical protein
MKKLYEFVVYKEEEVEQPEIIKNEQGEELKVLRKVKTKVPHKFFLKKPTRSMHDEADLYYGVRLSEGIKAGLLTNMMLAKRFADDGGTVSETDKSRYGKLYLALFDKYKDYHKLNLKSPLERTPEENQQFEELKRFIVNAQNELVKFETSQSALFDNTAEIRARNKTVLWWILHLSYKYNEKGEVEPFFPGETLEERLAIFDTVDESEDEFIKLIVRKLTFFTTFWYTGRCNTQEDFEQMALEMEQPPDPEIDPTIFEKAEAIAENKIKSEIQKSETSE